MKVRLDPGSTALVIIDMENEFCKPGGKLYHPDAVDEVIPKMKDFLTRCRGAGAQRIFVRSVRFPDSPEFSRFGQPPILQEGTWNSEYIGELAPEKGEAVVQKNTHDCFYKTEMDSLLREWKIHPETHSIVVGGINAHICVYHAVVGFHVRHYNVVVPLDCCAGPAPGRAMLETQMADPAYSYNVKLTSSSQIEFVP
jgi:nicotinamidase-related amidase